MESDTATRFPSFRDISTDALRSEVKLYTAPSGGAYVSNENTVIVHCTTELFHIKIGEHRYVKVLSWR